jgi:hypothetical protein
MRWFYSGSIPPEILNWFELTADAPEDQPLRVDRYLQLTDDDSLGIKLREGRLEVKRLQGVKGIVHLHERVAGRLEHWCKWIYDAVDADGKHLETLFPGSAWIAVEKDRILQRLRLTGKEWSVVPPANEPDWQGCDLELTRIHVGGQEWWTLGFEAYGSEPTLKENLISASSQVFAIAEPPALRTEDSLSYPGWLAMLADEGGLPSRDPN